MFSNKFTNLGMAVPAATRVRVNREIFMPLIQGALSVELAEAALLAEFFPREEVAMHAWIPSVIRDLLHSLRGTDMVRIGVTSSYPSDGAGAGIGLRLRKAHLYFSFSPKNLYFYFHLESVIFGK